MKYFNQYKNYITDKLVSAGKVKYYVAAGSLIVASFLYYGWKPQKAEAIVPYTNTRINTSSAGTQANGGSVSTGNEIRTVDLSLNGRFAAFSSAASNLVANDTNNATDVFVKDTVSGTITRVSVSTAGAEASAGTGNSVAITKDGRYVLFTATQASVFQSGTGGSNLRLFRHDRQTGTTVLVSNPGGMIDQTGGFDMTSDGRYIAYVETKEVAIPGASLGGPQVLIKDMQSNTYTVMSKKSDGTVPLQQSKGVSISCDGSKVAFVSNAALTSSDTNYYPDLYIVNRIGGDSLSMAIPGGSGNADPNTPTEMSCDGSAVVFYSQAAGLIPSESPDSKGLFAYETATGLVSRVGVQSNGAPVANVGRSVSVSADGSLVTFSASGSGIVTGDTGNTYDIFLRNRTASTTERISMRNSTTETVGHSYNSSISPEGTSVLYVTDDSGLVQNDTNAAADVFLANSGASACKL